MKKLIILLTLLVVAIAAWADRRAMLFYRQPSSGSSISAPTNVPNLYRWYDASVLGYSADTAVGSTALWTNMAYSGDDLTQTTSGFRPLYKTGVQNGKAGVYFDGTDDLLSMTAIGAQSAITVMAIFHLDVSLSSSTYGLLDHSASSDKLYYSRSSSANVDARITDNDGTSGISDTFSSGTEITNAVMVVWAANGTDVQYYQNGTNRGSDSLGTFSLNLNRMGAASGQVFKGWMHEVCVWTNYKASATEVAGLWSGYASNKWFAPSAAAPAWVQDGSLRDFPSGSTHVVTLTGVTGGNALIAGVAWAPTNLTLTSITDDKGNSYTLRNNPRQGTYGNIAFGHSFGVTGGTVAITATFSGTPSVAILVVHEVSGVSAYDTSATGDSTFGSGTDSISLGLTTSVANTYIFGLDFNTTQNGGPSAGTGYTTRETFGGNNGCSIDRVFSGSGSVNVLWTLAAFDNHTYGAMALKP